MVKGDGVLLYDVTGRRFLDAYSGLWNVNLGFSDNEIKDAMKNQIGKLPYCNPIISANENAKELGELLCKITHEEIAKVIYTCTGSEAIEAAIKISRKYNNCIGKNAYKIAVISESYHGNYYGSMSASCYDEKEKDGYGPMLDGFVKLVLPFDRTCKTDHMTDECKLEILERLEEELQRYKNDLCAIIVEPILASGGVIPLFEEYILKLYHFCKQNNILFVCDEVATGFGRTGTMFRFQQFELKPDIITMSKGINNGYLPLGAVCISKKIEDVFEKSNKPLFHLSTQNANPICLAGAIATIKKMLRINILEQVKDNSKYFRHILNAELSNLCIVHEIRMYGLMVAVDLAYKEDDRPIEKELLVKIVKKVCSMGCLIGTSFTKNITSSLLIFPSFISTRDNLDEIVRIINIVLHEIL